MDPIVVTLTRSDILRSANGTGRHLPKKVFLAYRMQDRRSCAMRSALGGELSRRGIDLIDGQVEAGEAWAPVIRKRLRPVPLLVADVTGPSREVVFEMGVAGNKRILPIVADEDNRRRVPRWLSATQAAIYEDTGVGRIADRIESYLVSQVRPVRRPAAVPNLAIWLRADGSDWCQSQQDRFQVRCDEQGVDLQVIYPDNLTSPEDLLSYLRAWLVVCALDGGAQDFASHYFLGDVVARRTIGVRRGAATLERAGLVLTQDDQDAAMTAADSLQRIPRRIVHYSSRSTFLARANALLERRRRWLRERP